MVVAMINEQIKVIRKIKELLKNAGITAGEYPFDVDKYARGDWDNVALIQDGDEDISDNQQNGSVTKDYAISIWIYSNQTKQRIEHVLDMQASVESLIMPYTDLSLDGTVECVRFLNIEKGELLDEFTGHEPGYSGNHTCRKINYNMRIKQMR